MGNTAPSVSSNGAAATMAGTGGTGLRSAGPRGPIQPPNLLSRGEPCRGFYPAAADADHGEVRVVVDVESDGLAHGSTVLAEVPSRQGFATAARACVARLRFRPARDAAGGAVPGRAVLALRFDRS
jgi:outer membrane biosynthesis protein TonB